MTSNITPFFYKRLRFLRTDPIFAISTIMVLALAVGATTAIACVLYSVLLRPLPYRNPTELATLWETSSALTVPITMAGLPVREASYVDWRSQNQTLSGLAAIAPTTFDLVGYGQPERIEGASVSASLFSVLGVAPQLGRAFTNEEDSIGKNNVVVIADTLWRRRFAANRNVIGQDVLLNSTSYTIVGVMPPGFDFPRRNELPPIFRFATHTELWRPIAFHRAPQHSPSDWNYAVITRLKPGRTMTQAQQELNVITERLKVSYPEANKGAGIIVIPLMDEMVADVRPNMGLLFYAVFLVVLISSLNLSTLSLARAHSRYGEIAIRLALGAQKRMLLVHLAREAVVLSIIGGGLGLLIAWAGVRVLVTIAPPGIPRIEEAHIDVVSLTLSVLTALLLGLVCCLAPVMRISKWEINEIMKLSASVSSESKQHLKMRSGLIIAQIALSFCLVLITGLMLVSFSRIANVDPGFRKDDVLTIKVQLSPGRYSEATRRVDLVEHLLSKIAGLPGVVSAGVIDSLPLTGEANISSVSIEGEPPPAVLHGEPVAEYRSVSPFYFDAMGISLLKGRLLSRSDGHHTVINQVLARGLFHNQDAIGKRLKRGEFGEPGTWLEIVGIVADVRSSGLDHASRAQAYVPYIFNPTYEMTLAVRTSIEPKLLAAPVRREIWSLDADQPIAEVKTMGQWVSDSLLERQFVASLLTVFALLALMLALLGVFGMAAFNIARRRQEIGLRIALGSGPWRVAMLVLGQSLFLVVVGLSAGILLSMYLTHFLASQLYGVTASDPQTFASVVLLFLAISILGSWIPAHRASRIDPGPVLRKD